MLFLLFCFVCIQLVNKLVLGEFLDGFYDLCTDASLLPHWFVYSVKLSKVEIEF